MFTYIDCIVASYLEVLPCCLIRNNVPVTHGMHCMENISEKTSLELTIIRNYPYI